MPQLIGRLIRPVVATLAMVVVLWRLGLAWTPSAGVSVASFAADAGMRSAIGAACYGVIVCALWVLAGRPDGAERYAISMVIKMWWNIRGRG